jgi:PTH1 family peptidyl-tRNA hydrolase
MYKLCIIGLGNPDQKYNFTRHNIGKDWLKDISRTYDVDFSKKLKFEAEIAESHSNSILWVIPNNYVNNSGNTVFKIIKSTNLEARNFLILHDDLDLKIGNVRLKESGGHGY